MSEILKSLLNGINSILDTAGKIINELEVIAIGNYAK